MTVTAVGLRVEHHDGEPLGVGTARPRLSWRAETELRDWRQAGVGSRRPRPRGQAAVAIGPRRGPRVGTRRVARRPAGVAGAMHVAGAGVGRATGRRANGATAAAFEVGLLDAADWSAQVVAPAWDEPDTANQPCPHVRTRFAVDASIERARLHVSALGVYEATINGQPVGDHVLAPGWTAYRSRIHVQTFDVTALLEPART